MSLPDVTMELTGDGADVNNDRTGVADRRSDLDVWFLIAAMMSLVVVAFWAAGLTVDFASNPALLGIAFCYALVACFYTFIRKVPEIAHLLIVFAQVLLILISGLLLTYAVSAIPLPYRDAELYALDNWIGFDRAAFLKFLLEHPTFLSFVYVGYFSIIPQFMATPFALLVTGHKERCSAYLMAYGVSLTAACIIAAFVPAANALVHVDLPAAGYGELSPHIQGYFPTLEALRTGILRHIPLCDFQGLISFPSFHTVSAILFVWALWPLRLLRWLVVPLNLLMIVGTPGFGAHYLVDVFAGAIVAWLSIVAANHIRGRMTASPSV